MSMLTRFEKQRLMEKKKSIAKSLCRICRQPIGSKPYTQFEERFFHTNCLKKGELSKG